MAEDILEQLGRDGRLASIIGEFDEPTGASALRGNYFARTIVIGLSLS